MSFQKNKLQSGKRSYSPEWSNLVFNRMAFLAGLLVVFVLFVLYAPQKIHFFYYAVPVFAGLLFVLSVFLFFFGRSRTDQSRERAFSFSFLAWTALISAFLVSCTFAMKEPAILILAASAAVGLAFVRYTYSHDFFWLSLSFFAGLILAVLPRAIVIFPGNTNAVISVVCAVLAVLLSAAFCCVALAALSGKHSALSDRFFNAGYVRRYPLFLLPVISVCCSAVRLFAPRGFSYALIASVVLYFVFLVIYAFDNAQ